jgi:hypothetical protein
MTSWFDVLIAIFNSQLRYDEASIGVPSSFGVSNVVCLIKASFGRPFRLIMVSLTLKWSQKGELQSQRRCSRVTSSIKRL